MQRLTMEGVYAPELAGGHDDWINSPPLKLKGLRGRIVLVDFWDYTCINCLRTLPYVREWHERYKHWGVVVIGIHTPEFEFAKSRGNVEEAVRRLGINYPVLLDSNYENWSNFANRFWPREYLIDTDGKIVYDHIGEGDCGRTEAAIQNLILRDHPEAGLPDILEAIRPQDEPGAVCYPMTPETYTGYYRGALGNPEGYQPNVPHNYCDPGERIDGMIYLHGMWLATAEALIHPCVALAPDDYLALQYHALEVNAVIKPEDDAEFEVFVAQDGEPVHPDDHGEDIKTADDGRTYVHIDRPRMYNLIKNHEFGSHELRLWSPSDSLGIYAFTYGSCREPD